MPGPAKHWPPACVWTTEWVDGGAGGGGHICSFCPDSLLCLSFSLVFLTFSVSLHPDSFSTPLAFIRPLLLAHTTVLSYSICAISALPFTFRLLLFPSACCVRAGWGWCGLDGPGSRLPLILQQMLALGLVRSWYLSGRCCRRPLPPLILCPNGRAGLRPSREWCLGATLREPCGHTRGRSWGGFLISPGTCL